MRNLAVKRNDPLNSRIQWMQDVIIVNNPKRIDQI